MIRAMILAAGLGSRLGALTRDLPKPLLPVGGRPVLDRTIEACRTAGIHDIVINLHHGGDAIRARYGDGRDRGVHIEYSVEERLLGTAGALLRARDLLGKRFLVIYGDNVFRFRLRAIVEHDRAAAAIATLGVYPRRDIAASGLVRVREGGEVSEFVEKPREIPPGEHLVFAGICAIAARALDVLPEDTPSDIGKDLIPRLLAKGELISAFRLAPGELYWLDTPEDYERTSELLQVARIP